MRHDDDCFAVSDAIGASPILHLSGCLDLTSSSRLKWEFVPALRAYHGVSMRSTSLGELKILWAISGVPGVGISAATDVSSCHFAAFRGSGEIACTCDQIYDISLFLVPSTGSHEKEVDDPRNSDP